MVLLMFMLSMILGQAPLAFAKTLQTNIANPSNDTVVLNVKIGGVTLPYTWGDLKGIAGYKFAGTATADRYLSADPHDICEGIGFSDLISDIESILAITLQDDYKIKAVSSDGYINTPFTVGEAKNPANHYLLANEVNGVTEACIGYKDSDPSVTYPETYLRVARNRGGDYSTDSFGNTAYMRLISSLWITRPDDTAVVLADINLAQNNGAGLSALSPAAAGLVIGGSGITHGMGLQNSFVYLGQAQVDYIKANKSLTGLGLGNSWMPPALYSSYHNHGTPEYVYTLAEGINLKTALTALGADVTSSPVAVGAKSSDGFDQIIDDAFGYNAHRSYFAPDGTVGAAVDPVLVFYAGKVTTSTPDSSTVIPTTTTAIANPNPLFAYGQKFATENNNCSFVQNTVKVRAGMDTPALTVTKESTTKSISLSDIALTGIYRTSYFWENNGAQVTQSVVGVPLNVLLSTLGITVPSDMGLVININDGSGTVAGNRTISYEEINKCFVAYDAFEDSQRVSGGIKPLRIYCPGQTQSNVLIENVVGATVSAVNQNTVRFEENGGSTVPDITQASGSTIDTAPASSKDGYTLEGWYMDAGLANKVTFPYMVTENTTLYAKWTEISALGNGDINGDGSINIKDVVLTVNFVLGKTTPTTEQFNAADFNSDGNLDIKDIVLIVNKVLGK